MMAGTVMAGTVMAGTVMDASGGGGPVWARQRAMVWAAVSPAPAWLRFPPPPPSRFNETQACGGKQQGDICDGRASPTSTASSVSAASDDDDTLSTAASDDDHITPTSTTGSVGRQGAGEPGSRVPGDVRGPAGGRQPPVAADAAVARLRRLQTAPLHEFMGGAEVGAGESCVWRPQAAASGLPRLWEPHARPRGCSTRYGNDAKVVGLCMCAWWLADSVFRGASKSCRSVGFVPGTVRAERGGTQNRWVANCLGCRWGLW
jgi:hypothetical protein